MRSKRLTSKCGITIPKDIRAQVGWWPGMGVDIEEGGDHSVIIRPHVPVCRFCGAVDHVIEVSGISVCRDCATVLREELDKYGLPQD